ncbi:MAG: hypothetical protein K2X66_17030, partial [Cyanobacteria bacterium]|nr:hypothetical protein [Cyanobacteriota bacterium]
NVNGLIESYLNYLFKIHIAINPEIEARCMQVQKFGWVFTGIDFKRPLQGIPLPWSRPQLLQFFKLSFLYPSSNSTKKGCQVFIPYSLVRIGV